MKAIRYEGCCVARVVSGFGQSATAIMAYTPDIPYTVKSLRKGLKEEVRRMKRNGEAILTCITNSDQTIAHRALELEGWTGSPWTKKKNHPTKMVKIWYKLVDPQTEEGVL